jgi:hypothetical protein
VVWRKFEGIETFSMKTILSILKPVGKGLDWMRQGLVMFWRVSKVEFFPTEKNLLLCFWYSYVHFKARNAIGTISLFLDNEVVYIKMKLEDLDSSSKKRQLYRDLLDALRHRRLSEILINFLESSPPEDHYLPVVEAMKRAWRDNGEQITAPEKTESAKLPEEGDATGDVPEFNAKAYYIAAELYYEQAGRSGDFEAVCQQMSELKAFVQKQFKVAQLPGTFDKLKGYTYKNILTWDNKNKGKKGQLRPHFRQIADHPEVFSEAIAGRARDILAEHFN